MSLFSTLNNWQLKHNYYFCIETHVQLQFVLVCKIFVQTDENAQTVISITSINRILYAGYNIKVLDYNQTT